MAVKWLLVDLIHSARFGLAVLARMVSEPISTTRRIFRVLVQGGVRACFQRAWFYYRSHVKLTHNYNRWLDEYGTLSAADHQAIRRHIEQFVHTPLLSIIMPVYNPPLPFLLRAVESVRAQLYPHWELCIADDASTEPEVRPALEQLAQSDARIRVTFRPVNGHIAAASNTAIASAAGEYLVLLDQDDELAPHALYMVAEALNRHPDTDILYSDEDKIDLRGNRFGAYFKPGWSWELIRSQNMVSHLGVYRTSLVRSVGGFRMGLEGSQDYDLLLRCVEKTGSRRVYPIADVLYHWRALPGSTARGQDAKPYAYEAGARSLREHLARCQIAADVSPGDWPGIYRVRYRVPAPPPLVSIILFPSPPADVRRKRPALDYANVEWLECPAVPPLTLAAGKNAAANRARGTLLCFLDAGLTPADPGWLTELVGLALQPDVGAVGALRLSLDGLVTHGGYTVAGDAYITNLCAGIPAGVPGPAGVCVTPRDCAAVSGSCLVVRREVFERAGGLDDGTFANTYHDVDFCLRLGQLGYRVVWTPHACFAEPVAFDPVGRAETPWAADDEATKAFRLRWAGKLQPERFLSPHYNPCASDFSLALPSPVRRPWKAANRSSTDATPAAGAP